jgi:Domain of unknown function (DUF6265)
MNMRILLASIALALAPAAGAACQEGPELPEWMTGSWMREDANGWADEYWTPARGGMMIGAGRSGKGEKLRFWEHMRIEREADGTVVFWAIAGNQKPVRFVAKEKTAEEIVFVNPDHDYPQRIHYWREGGQLKAEISLIDGSKATQFSFKPM